MTEKIFFKNVPGYYSVEGYELTVRVSERAGRPLVPSVYIKGCADFLVQEAERTGQTIDGKLNNPLFEQERLHTCAAFMLEGYIRATVDPTLTRDNLTKLQMGNYPNTKMHRV
jgi:hypothetical protein